MRPASYTRTMVLASAQKCMDLALNGRAASKQDDRQGQSSARPQAGEPPQGQARRPYRGRCPSPIENLTASRSGGPTGHSESAPAVFNIAPCSAPGLALALRAWPPHRTPHRPNVGTLPAVPPPANFKPNTAAGVFLRQPCAHHKCRGTNCWCDAVCSRSYSDAANADAGAGARPHHLGGLQLQLARLLLLQHPPPTMPKITFKTVQNKVRRAREASSHPHADSPSCSPSMPTTARLYVSRAACAACVCRRGVHTAPRMLTVPQGRRHQEED